MANIKMKISELFNQTTATPAKPDENLNTQNPNNKQEGETYHHWGLRVCAIANGSNYTLVPYLHNVYNYIHHEQVQNEYLQEQQHKNLECQIEQKRNDIECLNQKLNVCKQAQTDYKENIDELKNEKNSLRNKAYEVNKGAKIKLLLGLVILIPLTIYLFLFYSSTFYSAFFKDFGEGANLMNSMFDANALSKALETSITELCFVLSAPVIFMGLGFSLHFFTIQKTWTKYIKMGAILGITFLFDAILAYMIGKHLHDMEVIIGTAGLDSTYGIGDAIGDINTWAVIFCGFIVYIIWGIVFDMSMSAYDQLDLNKINIKAIDKRIEEIEQQVREEKTKEQSINKEINELNNNISDLTSQISSNVIIDKAVIRTEMTNFFAGWIAQMNVLGQANIDQLSANETFKETLNSLSI
ncbi:hypothetical protein [Segatella maculosa]|uniref:hypothetical protein n=1 Tax=Segatella maculosa TaxID=439703 RepID=UPI000361ED14|nr:hypothetical protein [Segatella maculosa]